MQNKYSSKKAVIVAINNNKCLESLSTHTACSIVWKGMFLRCYSPAAQVTTFLYYWNKNILVRIGQATLFVHWPPGSCLVNWLPGLLMLTGFLAPLTPMVIPGSQYSTFTFNIFIAVNFSLSKSAYNYKDWLIAMYNIILFISIFSSHY